MEKEPIEIIARETKPAPDQKGDNFVDQQKTTKQKVKRMKTVPLETPHTSFIAPDFGGQPLTWKEHLEWLKQSQSNVRRIERATDFAQVTMRCKLPIALVFTSDWHLGAKGTDYELWEKDMQAVKDEPLAKLIPLSNTIDNFIFPSGMFEQLENPSMQQEMVKQFAHDFSDKWLAIVGSRCHEGWTKQKADVEVNKLIFEEQIDKGVPWMPEGGVLNIRLNNIDYALGLVHKGRGGGGQNPTNTNRMLHDMRWPVDILAIAHDHQAQVLQGVKYEGKFRKNVTFIRTGTYKTKDAYGEGEGFGQGQSPSSQVAVIFPYEKRIIPFLQLRDGLEYVKMARSLSGIKEV